MKRSQCLLLGCVAAFVPCFAVAGGYSQCVSDVNYGRCGASTHQVATHYHKHHKLQTRYVTGYYHLGSVFTLFPDSNSTCYAETTLEVSSVSGGRIYNTPGVHYVSWQAGNIANVCNTISRTAFQSAIQDTCAADLQYIQRNLQFSCGSATIKTVYNNPPVVIAKGATHLCRAQGAFVGSTAAGSIPNQYFQWRPGQAATHCSPAN